MSACVGYGPVNRRAPRVSPVLSYARGINNSIEEQVTDGDLCLYWEVGSQERASC